MRDAHKKEDTRQRLIEAGATILHRQGYNGTGIQEVLAACGVPKGSFYHFFKSKEDFVLAVVDHYATGMGKRVLELFSDVTHSPLARLRLFFDQMIERVNDVDNPFSSCGCPIGNLVQEMAPLNAAFRHRLDEVLDGLERAMATVLRQAQAVGEIGPRHDADELARFIVASWHGAILRMKAAGGPEPLVRARAFLLGMLNASATGRHKT